MIVPIIQGTIVFCHFPYTDEPNGVFKLRPAVVISKDYNANDFIVAMITSQIKKDKYSFFIEPAFLTDPLDKTSEVRCDRIATVNRKLITKNISSLTPAATKELIQKITKNFT